MARIVQVATCALATFSNKPTSLEPLTLLLSALTPSDVGLDGKMLAGPVRTFFSPFQPSATVIDILSNSIVTIGTFILAPGQKIPLHDHPGMHGLIKCIHGKLQVKSYTPLPPTEEPIVVPHDIIQKLNNRSSYKNLIPCKFESCLQVSASSSDPICKVTPNVGNIHEVSAVEGTSAAFVDVLSPPYDSEVDCNYYEVIGSTYDAKIKQDVTWLLQLTAAPSSYWTVSSRYTGPPIDL